MASSYSSCGGVLPAAAANQPPKLSVSSTNGRGMFSSGGVSSAIAINASASASPRCLKLMGFNGKPITSITSVRFRCNSQLPADFAPATAAAYGALLSSGGLFACNIISFPFSPLLLHIHACNYFAFFLHLSTVVITAKFAFCMQIEDQEAKDRLLEDLQGDLSWLQ